MKYLLIPALLLTTIVHAQTVGVYQCVIENGNPRIVVTEYNSATGDYAVTTNGIKKTFNEAFPPAGKDYAANTPWFINNEPILLNGNKYVKYGLPRVIEFKELSQTSAYKNIGVYVEMGIKGAAEVIYIPSRRGCEFQPYQIEGQPQSTTRTIYYDADWKKTTKEKASYYRFVAFNNAGEPVGLVQDFYLSGEKQWEGRMSYIDPNENQKDITEGICTWFYKNGKKSAQVTMLHGKEQGVYRTWREDGSLETEAEYKNGLLHGYFKTYTSNGQLSGTKQYANGQIDRN
jgi:hypothetical protein